MNYLLDANTYIQAKNQYYGMDICPAYWDWLDQQFQAGTIASVNMVARELIAGNDELAAWVKERPGQFLENDDEATQQVFAEIAQFVGSNDFQPASRDKFLSGADPWLIAKAKVLEAVVVSHESRLVTNTKQVKVPNICHQFDVRCVDTFELLRELQARFVLQRSI